MAYQGINTGSSPNSGTGDSLIQGAEKVNSNFVELYNIVGNGTTTLVGIVTQITAGTNVSVSTSYGSVEISAPTPSQITTTNLNVSGVSTLGAISVTGATSITGVTSITGATSITGVTSITGSVLISGITTLASSGGITTTGGHLYVGGDLYVLDDVVCDEVTGRNLNITGVGTVAILGVSSTSTLAGDVSIGSSLSVSGVSTLTGNVSLGSSLLMGDDKQFILGEQSEFTIFHNDSDGNVIRANVASLNIKADTQNYTSGAGTTQIMATNVDGNYGIEFYYNNNKRLETRHGGVDVLGYLKVTGISTLGIVTGATYYGDGSNLTGVVTSLTGADGSAMVGVVTTLTGANGSVMTGVVTSIIAGANITLTGGPTGIVTIASSGGVGVGTTNVSTNSLVVSGISTLGVVTGATYYGDASLIVDGRWTLGANGTSDYTFTGVGFTQTTNDPDLYLARGRVYEFVNNMGAHPFRIQGTPNGSVGTAWTDGVTNNDASNGTVVFEVPFNSPNTLYYQCTVHAGMGGTFFIYPTLR